LSFNFRGGEKVRHGVRDTLHRQSRHGQKPMILARGEGKHLKGMTA